MKTSTLKKAIPAALLLAGVSGLSSNANATAYAISYDNIFNLAVTSTAPDGSGGPFYVPLSDFNSFTAVSSTSAFLNSVPGLPSTDIAGGPVDAQVTNGAGSVYGDGSSPLNNAMTAEGQDGNYSYGDAQVSQTSLSQAAPGGPVTATGTLTQAWNIAEGFIGSDGTASSAGNNTSTTGFNTTITLQDSAVFNFNFNADPYMYVEMGAGSTGTVNANLDVTFSITSQATGGPVFTWSPNGQVGTGIFGGTEFADGADLNGSIQASSPGQTATFDPNGNGAPDGTINPSAFSTFSARTFTLTPGVYTLSLNMNENIDIRTSAAPAPGVLGLFGLGLAALGFSRRRSRK